MDRVFLDANVLFSAAFRPNGPMQRLWGLRNVELLTSAYALQEARRHLTTAERQVTLVQLTSALRVVPAAVGEWSVPGVRLAEKDIPILLAAVQAEATHLLTGDLKHFGPYLGTRIGGVLILKPAAYLAQHSE